MKQKLSASETLTKKDLVDVLKEFRLDLQVDLDEMELKIEDSARQLQSEVLSRFDAWAGELEVAREDRILTTKQLHNHEQRISKLESV